MGVTHLRRSLDLVMSRPAGLLSGSDAGTRPVMGTRRVDA